MALCDLIPIRNVADMIWLDVDCYQNWLDMDHQKMTFEGKTSEETVESCSNISRNTFMEPNTNMNAIPKDWPHQGYSRLFNVQNHLSLKICRHIGCLPNQFTACYN